MKLLQSFTHQDRHPFFLTPGATYRDNEKIKMSNPQVHCPTSHEYNVSECGVMSTEHNDACVH